MEASFQPCAQQPQEEQTEQSVSDSEACQRAHASPKADVEVHLGDVGVCNVQHLVLQVRREGILDWRDVLDPADPIRQIARVLEQPGEEEEGQQHHRSHRTH